MSMCVLDSVACSLSKFKDEPTSNTKSSLPALFVASPSHAGNSLPVMLFPTAVGIPADGYTAGPRALGIAIYTIIIMPANGPQALGMAIIIH